MVREISRTSGHELRNALNALVVNLEVVSSTAGTLDEKAKPFMAQAVEQSEESVRLAEAAIALLNLFVDAVDGTGHLAASQVAERGVRIESAEAVRVAQAVGALASRSAVRAEATDAAVILSISEESGQRGK